MQNMLFLQESAIVCDLKQHPPIHLSRYPLVSVCLQFKGENVSSLSDFHYLQNIKAAACLIGRRNVYYQTPSMSDSIRYKPVKPQASQLLFHNSSKLAKLVL